MEWIIKFSLECECQAGPFYASYGMYTTIQAKLKQTFHQDVTNFQLSNESGYMRTSVVFQFIVMVDFFDPFNFKF